MKKSTKPVIPATQNPLPKGIVAKDLTRPKWSEKKGNDEPLASFHRWDEKLQKSVATPGLPEELRDSFFGTFEMWFVPSFGWCIPTLLIKKAGRRRAGASDRTYAISVDGKPCRIGLGPHVKERVTVYVRESRMEALKPFLELMLQGQVKANETRDRISTSRMNARSRRSSWLGW